MKPEVSRTLWGYVLVGAASSGFYQQWYGVDDSLPIFGWVVMAAVGIVLLAAKNRTLPDKRQGVVVDLAYLLPTLLLPQLPIGHDAALAVMLGYACVFVLGYVAWQYHIGGRR